MKSSTNDWAAVQPSAMVAGPDRKLFDITIVVGSVYEDPHGVREAFDIAVATIAEHARTTRPPGPITTTYQFPDVDGETISVTIALPPAPRDLG